MVTGLTDDGLERILKALANKRRIAILRYLKKNKEATVGDISTKIRLSFRSTSKHLAVLYLANLLEREQRGVEMFYRIASNLNNQERNILSVILIFK